jgi:hypothetical protein
VDSEKTPIRTAATAASKRKCLNVIRGALAVLVACDPTPCEAWRPPIVSSVSTATTQNSLRFQRPSSASPKLHSQNEALPAASRFAAFCRELALVANSVRAPLSSLNAKLIRSVEYAYSKVARCVFSQNHNPAFPFLGDYRKGTDNNNFRYVTQF